MLITRTPGIWPAGLLGPFGWSGVPAKSSSQVRCYLAVCWSSGGGGQLALGMRLRADVFVTSGDRRGGGARPGGGSFLIRTVTVARLALSRFRHVGGGARVAAGGAAGSRLGQGIAEVTIPAGGPVARQVSHARAGRRRGSPRGGGPGRARLPRGRAAGGVGREAAGVLRRGPRSAPRARDPALSRLRAGAVHGGGAVRVHDAGGRDRLGARGPARGAGRRRG